MTLSKPRLNEIFAPRIIANNKKRGRKRPKDLPTRASSERKSSLEIPNSPCTQITGAPPIVSSDKHSQQGFPTTQVRFPTKTVAHKRLIISTDRFFIHTKGLKRPPI